MIRNYEGIRYESRRLHVGTHVWHNVTRGGTYRVRQEGYGWTIQPAHPVTLRGSGHVIGTAGTLDDVSRVIAAFEY